MTRTWIWRWLLVWLSAWATSTVMAAELTASGPDTNGWVRLTSPGETNRVHILEASADLLGWREAAVLHDGPFAFADVTAPTNAPRFLRLSSRAKTAADDGRNHVTLPHDPFVNRPEPSFLAEEGIGWVKFAILRDDETRVWFQDSVKHPFHHDFARLRLKPFLGMPRAEFDQRTLRATNQLAVLGAVLLPSRPEVAEFGLQFVGQEPFAREDIARWFALAQAAVAATPGAKAFYIPTFEQAAVAEANRDWFRARGIELASADRWLTGDATYSEGWAVGRLVFVPAAQIAAAYADGRLRPTDILLTDAVPAEVPFVAGLITLTPATPNSHVAILARGFGVPFVWFADPQVRADLLAWNGREIALRTGVDFGNVARVLDLEGELTPDLRAALAALKLPPALNYPPKQRLGVLATNVHLLTPAAAKFVGGKAANYGLLRRTIPSNSQPALALTFDLWDDFLDQPVPSGRTLRAEIAFRLDGLAYPPDVAVLRVQLTAVRELFTRTARFTPAQQAEILGALTNSGFLDPARKVRFRSSTNVEDGEDFTGAGLYDSYSGCLLDELDGDTSGPSACDPAESSERGVFRAIQRVYASFYNENAFLERLRRGVKEDEVGMAVLVHHSFPDSDELANGVATLDRSLSFGSASANGELVSQPGAASVTNPDSAARPEVVQFFSDANFIGLTQTQASGLLPLGGHVLAWETEYRALVRLLRLVAEGYAKLVPTKPEFSLDFEYKRTRAGRLEVKQVRPLPRPAPAAPIKPFLFADEVTLVVEEGEFGGDVFAKHRLKGELRLASDSRRLDAAGLATSFYRTGTQTYLEGTNRVRLTGGPTAWPEAKHSRAGDLVRDGWTLGTGAARRELTLETTVPLEVSPPAAPWFSVRDLRFQLSARYAVPQPSDLWNEHGSTTNDLVILVRPRPVSAASLPQSRLLTNRTGLRVETRFWWPEPPRGPSAGYTAPNLRFDETRITGLASVPVVLRDGFAQTYAPGHHNFTETFLFEPRLEPELPAAVLAELEAAGIRQLLVFRDWDQTTQRFWAVDATGKFRELK